MPCGLQIVCDLGTKYEYARGSYCQVEKKLGRYKNHNAGHNCMCWLLIEASLKILISVL